jgi:hypothetical protein
MEREYGGQVALELQQQAVAAFNADRHDDAIGYLRKAIRASSNPSKLEKELSQMLGGAAVSLVNQAVPSGSRNDLYRAKDMLEEAVQLDPGNQHAQANLMILGQMLP